MLLRWSRLPPDPRQPTLKNHTATVVDNKVLVFGGYDGQRNHNAVHIFDIETMRWRSCERISGEPPAGRNGHTATMADRKLYIIGGWLGSGPLAASDTHYLDLDLLRWVKPPVLGTPPGPCNMHTADYVAPRRRVYVFRGGDGREYLNDLHALDVDTHVWERVLYTGRAPAARANHCSAVVGEDLYIFGGWNGHTRLNDVHKLDTRTLVWTKLEPRGVLPQPRAGMTLTRVRHRLYLFGGSGPSAKCFDDLLILDLKEQAWTETTTRTRQCDSVGEASPEPQAASSHEPNPNDEHAAALVTILGEGPGPRAGHTATLLDRRMLIFGGSHGPKYLSDMYLLDTDPMPDPVVSAPSCGAMVASGLTRYFLTDDFADVTFLVEGHRVPAHRLVLSLVSERFRAMFKSGFREASEHEVEISDCSYEAFRLMLDYIYSGSVPDVLRIRHGGPDETRAGVALCLLELADQFMLDHLKQICECYLKDCVREETVEQLVDMAERTNARQLQAVCKHFLRNRGEWQEPSG